ncbi:AMMECR1 domain protein [Desulfurispirillum indicum S5]|uniref:AMMECR1 domain protein n=1 Tax=Desulfurispirillum indicum (strain ATCC BAA-1389 / DSM 22839 / S5) TaxID=653733 RepID=E6W203_DESIS|nr:AmmeMemoRadiSam system protein A [Desulfurispirillum indicum]ADU66629.1 AMMECR1 domain protein [Desulfurispirillum indicum S5]
MSSHLGSLPHHQQQEMLQLVRDTIGQELKLVSPKAHYDIPAMESGLFVTLTLEGQLRGCIGTFLPQPLRENLTSMACAAAFGDYRFKPLQATEFEMIAIEVTVLAPPKPVGIDDIVVGRHGLMVSLGSQRGVLLPQVAIEHQWSREEFLSFTCIKAGLPKEAYRSPDCTIEAVEAFIIKDVTG